MAVVLGDAGDFGALGHGVFSGRGRIGDDADPLGDGRARRATQNGLSADE
jgi:hypothetical protein